MRVANSTWSGDSRPPDAFNSTNQTVPSGRQTTRSLTPR